MEYYLVFESTSYAIKMELLLEKLAFSYRIRNVFSQISMGCGIMIIVYDLEQVENVITNNNLEDQVNIYVKDASESFILIKE